ncbi:protein NO VEIN domain-containing protein [Pseudosporangium ferrugineum]|uniref:protein NO VEIN domain-containing protein n=1 Tax=Pseudosporangium ferrugineum TaxID=439699 RepID=UPI0011B25817|nr:DUF3883 domain-containing protein [Pseudosporangium ferrugineum]
MRAAIRWLDRLPRSSPARSRALFTNHRDFSDLTPTQYEAAYAWLGDVGLLSDLHTPVPAAERVFTATITHGGSHWLKDAGDLVRSPDELPDDAVRAAEAAGLTTEAAFAHVITAWGKVDAAERVRVGMAGEAAVLTLLHDGVDAVVDHVAAVADGYGYDIAVHGSGCTLHLEIKSTLRRSRLTIHLSRNEYETMRRDPVWRLVAVRLNPDDSIAAIATVNREWMVAEAPADRGLSGRWESCRFDVPLSALSPGVLELGPVLRPNTPMLAGRVPWPGAAASRPNPIE